MCLVFKNRYGLTSLSLKSFVYSLRAAYVYPGQLLFGGLTNKLLKICISQVNTINNNTWDSCQWFVCCFHAGGLNGFWEGCASYACIDVYTIRSRTALLHLLHHWLNNNASWNKTGKVSQKKKLHRVATCYSIKCYKCYHIIRKCKNIFFLLKESV